MLYINHFLETIFYLILDKMFFNTIICSNIKIHTIQYKYKINKCQYLHVGLMSHGIKSTYNYHQINIYLVWGPTIKISKCFYRFYHFQVFCFKQCANYVFPGWLYINKIFCTLSIKSRWIIFFLCRIFASVISRLPTRVPAIRLSQTSNPKLTLCWPVSQTSDQH